MCPTRVLIFGLVALGLFAPRPAAAADEPPPYRVGTGNQVDARTLEGWRTWRAMACERCHGPNQEGQVGPSLVQSLKVLSKEEFKTTLMNGRVAKGMPNFGGIPSVVANLDGLYAFLKGRSDGAIPPGRLVAIPESAATPAGSADAPAGVPASAPGAVPAAAPAGSSPAAPPAAVPAAPASSLPVAPPISQPTAPPASTGPVVSAAEAGRVLRVCADPNNLPLSNRNGQGYENKIAELFARALGWSLEYTWYPQRMGFIRNTLRARGDGPEGYKCDLVMGLPVGFELAATTRPYYRSTWAMVFLRGREFDAVHQPDDLLTLPGERLHALKLGAFGQSPPVDWLLRHHLLDQVVPYRPQTGDPEQYTGEIVEKDLRAGKIDIAFVWGPIAGYFAGIDPARRLVVVPFPPDPEIKFDYAIAMGVRFGERAWKERIDRLIEEQRAGIEAILASYGVPQLDATGRLIPQGEAARVAAPASGPH